MSKKNEIIPTVSKNRAIKIFEALGFKSAKQWDTARLQKKLPKLRTLIEGAELDRRTQKRVDEILRAQNDGHTVKVIDTDDVVGDKRREKEVSDAVNRRENERKEKMSTKKKSDEKPNPKTKPVSKPSKKLKKPKSSQKPKKKEATKKETDKDKFGYRKGTNQSAINQALSRKWKTMDDLLKEAKQKWSQHKHLKKLIEAGYVEKSDKGFRLVK